MMEPTLIAFILVLSTALALTVQKIKCGSSCETHSRNKETEKHFEKWDPSLTDIFQQYQSKLKCEQDCLKKGTKPHWEKKYDNNQSLKPKVTRYHRRKARALNDDFEVISKHLSKGTNNNPSDSKNINIYMLYINDMHIKDLAIGINGTDDSPTTENGSNNNIRNIVNYIMGEVSTMLNKKSNETVKKLLDNEKFGVKLNATDKLLDDETFGIKLNATDKLLNNETFGIKLKATDNNLLNFKYNVLNSNMGNSMKRNAYLSGLVDYLIRKQANRTQQMNKKWLERRLKWSQIQKQREKMELL